MKAQKEKTHKRKGNGEGYHSRLINIMFKEETIRKKQKKNHLKNNNQ
jgi:hypothetical protein